MKTCKARIETNDAATDLGMLSMFGRTAAPTKGAANFCMLEKWATPE